MENGKSEWVAKEKEKQGGAAVLPLVANNSHANRALISGALHDFTGDCEAPVRPGKLAAATTIESKKIPYPPAVYVESDVSELPNPPFLHGQVHHYPDVSEHESPFLLTATLSHPPHIQHPSSQPQPSKINIALAHGPLERQSPWQSEHHSYFMLPTNLPSPPVPYNLQRVSFQHPPVRQKRHQQTFELAVDSDESEWWRSEASREEGGVELDTRVGMGVVDPPLRRRI
ncbi:hypothetical protein EV426DRAFT_592898 [Tirmania nivea]|nr:hypothetical protein EV426DRAFT_592898 [Tirmania nivea]